MDPLGKGTAKLMDLVVVIAIPSLVVGWQVIPAVVVVASFIATVLRRTIPLQSDMLGYFCLAMPIALTLQLVFWRVLHGVAFWPSDQSSMHAAPWVILGWAALALAAPAWLREPPSEPEAVEMIEKDPPPEEDPPQFTDESE
jgi:leader peptidase (prepilin peptidase)/N-methyltransferase